MLSRRDRSEGAPLAPGPHRGRVLVVEDDHSLQEAYADILLDAGFDVTTAGDVVGAFRALEAEPVDVVLSDVLMPGGTGVDLLRAVRERDLDMPVVLVTGNPSVETAVQAVEMGALHYLVKPVASAELLKAVENAARLRRLATVKREALRYLGRTDALMGDRAGLEAVFGRALDSLYMAYQPIVRTRDGSVFAWEALLRTREPSVAGPLQFFEIAEKLGRVRELGRAVRASVARTAARTHGVMFFVNLHADELLDEALYDPASPLSALAPEVTLEITERSPIDGVPDLRARRQRLREMGFRLAVDDLGSGYAGLTAYASLEPDFVKLDRGLVVGIDHEPVKSRLVASIVSASRDMGIAVVAEGIEAASERRAMAELGCELMQGYLFRRPEALKEEEFFSVGALPAAAAPEGGRKE
jgi:EAL domain-containing protein (putative c-di-GMP-specific phosphodiesterase class I)